MRVLWPPKVAQDGFLAGTDSEPHKRFQDRGNPNQCHVLGGVISLCPHSRSWSSTNTFVSQPQLNRRRQTVYNVDACVTPIADNHTFCCVSNQRVIFNCRENYVVKIYDQLFISRFVCPRRSTAKNGPILPETCYQSAGGRLYAVDGAFWR